MNISDQSLDIVRNFLDERSKAKSPKQFIPIAFRGQSSAAILSTIDNPLYAKLLKTPRSEQAQLLIAALHLLCQSGTNFVTEKLSVKERVQLMLDAIYDGSGKNFVQAFGSPLKYSNEPGALFSPAYDGVRHNPAQTREKTQIENIRKQVAAINSQGVSLTSFSQDTLRQLELQLAALEGEVNAKPKISENEAMRKYTEHQVKRSDLGDLIVSLMDRQLELSEEQLTFLLEAVTELTLSDRFSSSEASQAIMAPLIKYSFVMKCIDHFVAKNQASPMLLHAIDQYARCLGAGPAYDSDGPNKQAKQTLAKLEDICKANGFNGIFNTKVAPRTLTRTTYKPFDGELLGAVLKRVSQSLEDQQISYSAIYFGLADPDAARIERYITRFPLLASFATIHVPPMGNTLNVISNAPKIFADRYGLLSPPFVNQAACDRQVDVDMLVSVLDSAGKQDFSFFWSAIVIWGLQTKGLNIDSRNADAINEPHSMSSCIVLKTDLLPPGAAPLCKFISAEIIDGQGPALSHIGVELSSERGIKI